ncbi:MAG: MBL fold metallo-hydrolase [Terriglobia bacterium]
MELYRHVYKIQSLYHGRHLFQYFFSGRQRVLVDTGIASTPAKVIFPYLDKLKLDPRDISLAVTTHADLDHQGGNDAIKVASPRTWLSCGEADRELVEDPRALYNLRYNHLAKNYGLGLSRVPSRDAGKARKMDVTFSGGETIRLDDDWRLDVLHVPGHSNGHLALYDGRSKAAFVGDAIHGRGCPKAAGGMAIPVTYYNVDLYLSTLRFFEALPVRVVYSGHWPAMRSEEFRAFIAESRRTVELFDRIILASLARSRSGLTLKECIDAVASATGEWPKESWKLAMFPAKGHLDRLEALGKIRAAPGSHPIRWQLSR